jgi:DNA-binding transcriptional LysR family regulator
MTGGVFINIDILKMFCLVIDVGSISQAAKLSFVSQPAVTKQIRQLESSYGALLFDRKDGRLLLTKSGKTLYPFAKTIVEDFKRSKEAVQDSINNYESTLRVGASLTVGEYLLPSLLGRFKKLNPEYKLSLIIENTPKILEELSDNVIDLALVEGMVQSKDLLVESIADDELVLIYPPEHRWKNLEEVHIDELVEERMLWREPTSGTRLIIENFLKGHKVLDKIENYMELGSTQAIKSAVEAGLGISIVSRLTVARELKQGTLNEIKLKNTELKRNLWLVRKQQRFNKRSVEAFVKFIRG